MQTGPVLSRAMLRIRSLPDHTSRRRFRTWMSTTSPPRCLPMLTCCQATTDHLGLPKLRALTLNGLFDIVPRCAEGSAALCEVDGLHYDR